MNTQNIEDLYPLSAMQQGMLFHSLAAPESGVYVDILSCSINGGLDLSAFQHAWKYVLDQTPILRSGIIDPDLAEPYQVVYQHLTVPFARHDWRGRSPETQAADFEQFIQGERRRGLELTQPPLLRLDLIQLGDERYHFVWTHHHMLLDGWSLPLVLHDVFAAYDALAQGQSPHLPSRRPYRDYIAWLDDQDMAQAEDFWRGQLKGFSAPTPLVIDRTLKSVVGQEMTHRSCSTRLSSEVTGALQVVARRHHLTLNTMVQGAWAILLSRYTGEPDVLFGATVAGRPAELAGVEAMVGLFINTLPVRARIDHDQPVSAWLERFQQQSVAMRQYEYAPLPEIQGWSDVPRGMPLFESLVVFENYPLSGALPGHFQDLRIDDLHILERTNYPLTLASSPAEPLRLNLSYDTRRFDHDQIERMVGHLRTLLEGIAADPSTPLGLLPLLTDAERQTMLVDWNQTARDYPLDICVHQHFEARVDQLADEPVVFHNGRSLTFLQLNQRANQLAHYLQRCGVKPETFVGVYLERSIDWVVAFTAILKAGGVYVPISPQYPRERVEFMLSDTNARITLTQARFKRDLTGIGTQLFCMDEDWELVQHESAENPESGITGDNLAYVIYTSGSTGLPKGVMIEHRSFANQVCASILHFNIDPHWRRLQFADMSFDVSLADLGRILAGGGKLVIADEAIKNSPTALIQTFREFNITNVSLPPSVLAILPPNEVPATTGIVAGGEAVSREIVARWAVDHHIWNGYGPTEATINATFYDCDPDEQTDPPIGKPMGNYQTYVLDDHLQPLPVGVPGELHIGGIGVARGYLNRPDLTAERFIPDPFRTTPGARLYKTGDLVRYRADGNLEFLGRLDHQVKIRGYRIELGEIEARLRQHPAVRETVVLAREDTPGDKRLVAYLTTGEQLAPSVSELRGFLKQTLPDYMLPSHFVVLVTFPLTPNGKIDRQHLPPPTSERPELASAYVAPRTPQERQLAAIWQEVLGVEQVGIADNFFDLGGASLQTLEAASRAQEIGVPLTPELLFVYPTIAELSELAEGGN